jgi:hypothetical protein
MAKSRNEKLKEVAWFTTDTANLLTQLNTGIGNAVDDLSDVIDWLREEKDYEKADRLKTIAGRLARMQRPSSVPYSNKLTREIARGWT